MVEIDMSILELEGDMAKKFVQSMIRIENLKPSDPEYIKRKGIFGEIKDLDKKSYVRIKK